MTTHTAKFELSQVLNADPDRVWELLQRPETLQFIAWPLIRFAAIGPLPERFEEADYEVRMYLGGFLPLGRQEIRVSRRRQGERRVLRDDGRGQLIERWDHRIVVEPGPTEGTTRYRDTVDTEAGLLTPLVRAFAALFYRHRQRRWRKWLDTSAERAL